MMALPIYKYVYFFWTLTHRFVKRKTFFINTNGVSSFPYWDLIYFFRV